MGLMLGQVIETSPLDHLPLMGRTDDVALDGRAGQLTYGELEIATGRLAAWLARFRLPAGERIASWLAKGQVAAILPLACARAGLVHVPINPLLKRAQVAHILADSGARLLVSAGGRTSTLFGGDVPRGCELHDERDVVAAMSGGEGFPPSGWPADHLAAILYTSGSTGKPKGVMLSHANLWLGAVSVAHYLALTSADRVLAVLPLSFDYGQNQLLSTWAAGGCVVPLDFLTARDVIKAVEANGITTLAGVPPLWVQLSEAEWPEATAARLRRLTNSGGALTRPLIAAMRQTFRHAEIFAMYGLTEAFRSTYLKPALLAAHPDSIGTAIPHAEIMVVRPDGTTTDDDEPGELVHCGPLVAQGYWNDSDRTAERFRPAPASSRYGGVAVWSGDTVRRDSAGLLSFVGRTDGMIKSSGNRISPSEIEEVAVAIDGVVEAVALGVPDERLGQAIRLYLRLSRGCNEIETADKVKERIRQELPNFMMPRDIRFVDAFPKTPNGKIDRVSLAQAEQAA